MSENKKVTEMIHGCIVCGKLFTILVVDTPAGKMVDCSVTSPGGHIVPDKHQPLVACDTHPADVIESAHKARQSRVGKESNFEQEED